MEGGARIRSHLGSLKDWATLMSRAIPDSILRNRNLES